MSDHNHTASEWGLLPILLRSGKTIYAMRAMLEACFGLWSTEPELCEDGRATLLTRLPADGALYLTRTGEILEVQPMNRGDVLQARLFTGSGDVL